MAIGCTKQGKVLDPVGSPSASQAACGQAALPFFDGFKLKNDDLKLKKEKS